MKEDMDKVMTDANKALTKDEILANILIAAEAAKISYKTLISGEDKLPSKLAIELSKRAFDYTWFSLNPDSELLFE